MRFTINSIGTNNYWSKDLTQKILSHSKSVVAMKHSNFFNSTNTAKFDESCLFLYEDDKIFVKNYVTNTNFSTFRYKMSLFFSLDYIDSKVTNLYEKRTSANFSSDAFPHDFYYLAHSPRNGSMWLMNNVMFFNKTCNLFYHPINFFNSSSMKWSTSRFVTKYKFYNNCSVHISVGNEQSAKNVVHEETLKKRDKFTSSIYT